MISWIAKFSLSTTPRTEEHFLEFDVELAKLLKEPLLSVLSMVGKKSNIGGERDEGDG